MLSHAGEDNAGVVHGARVRARSKPLPRPAAGGADSSPPSVRQGLSFPCRAAAGLASDPHKADKVDTPSAQIAHAPETRTPHSPYAQGHPRMITQTRPPRRLSKPDWAPRYLAALEAIPPRRRNITAAALASNVGRRTVYERRDRDPDFARRLSELLSHPKAPAPRNETQRPRP